MEWLEPGEETGEEVTETVTEPVVETPKSNYAPTAKVKKGFDENEFDELFKD